MNRDEQHVQTGVVVLGHGSRASEAGILLEWISDRVAERCDFAVAPASLQFNSPTLAESCRRLASEGVKKIVVAPYFLFSGNHMKQDIPGELQELQRELGGVELVLAGSLGADERLVDVMQSRIAEALAEDGAGTAGVEAMEAGTEAAGAAGDLAPPPRTPDEIGQHPIEAESFQIIDGILKPGDPEDPIYQVARRVVHATGDPQLAGELVFSTGAVEAALSAFAAGADIICDVNMVAAGMAPTAAAMGLDVHCLISDEETRILSASEGITRGAAGIRRSAGRIAGSVIVIGNAPTALFECLRLIRDEGVRPALIIGVPVGFVGAAESKEVLGYLDIPHVTLPGYRGGSNVAVAIVNALMRLAAGCEGGRT